MACIDYGPAAEYYQDTKEIDEIERRRLQDELAAAVERAIRYDDPDGSTLF